MNRTGLFTTIFMVFWSYACFAQPFDPGTPPFKKSLCGEEVILGFWDTESLYVLPPGADEFDVQVLNLVEVFVDFQGNENFVGNYTVKIDLRISLGPNLSSLNDVHLETLNIDYDSENPAKSVHWIFEKEGNYAVKVEILDIVQIPVPLTQDEEIHLPVNMCVQMSIAPERYPDFSSTYQTVPSISTPIQEVNLECSGADVHAAKIEWNFLEGADYYELEYVYVNDYHKSALSTRKPPTSLYHDFRENSVRVEIRDGSNYYFVPYTFDRGVLYFRVRGVGYVNQNVDVPIYGAWSSGASNDPNTPYVVIDGMDSKFNWQVVSDFFENGKRKQAMSIHDGMARERQRLTRLEADEFLNSFVVAGESVYDLAGRPAIEVLPSPVIQTCGVEKKMVQLRYYPNLNKNASDEKYSAADFDLEPTDCEPMEIAPLGESSGAGKYYSSANTLLDAHQAFVPDAEGFPMSQTSFTQDKSGRISSQGGVGKEFQIGSGHFTTYFYGQPNQLELDRLFGSEAGYASRYQKEVQVDPHGQISITFKDQFDRVVATAMAGEAPDFPASDIKMAALPQALETADWFTVDLLGGDATGNSDINVVSEAEGEIELNYNLLVTWAGTHTFEYGLSQAALTDDCVDSEVCFNCVYDLEISIVNECGEDVLAQALGLPEGETLTLTAGTFTPNQNNGIAAFTLDCEANMINGSPLSQTGTGIFLEVGSYSIHKKLKINDDGLQFALEQYLSHPSTCIQTEEEFIQTFMAGVDTTGCSIDCDACVAMLGTLEDFLANGFGSEMEYEALLNECLDPCTESTLCDVQTGQMLIDVSPHGQYGMLDFDDSGEAYSEYALSVFNTENILAPNLSSDFPNQQNGLANWRNPYLQGMSPSNRYVDELGTPVKIYLEVDDAGNYSPEVFNVQEIYTDPDFNNAPYIFPQNLVDLTTFVNDHWIPSFAKSLLVYHPEYCYYRACLNFGDAYEIDGVSRSSEDFDRILLGANTFQEAENAGLIHPIGGGEFALGFFDPSDEDYLWDPFALYDAEYGFPQDELISRFENYMEFGGNWFSAVDVIVSMVQCPNATSPAQCSGVFGGNPDTQDQEWSLLKGIYVSLKQEMQLTYQEGFSLEYCGMVNDCIGEDAFSPSYGSLPTNIYYNVNTGCSHNTKSYFSIKEPIFVSPVDIMPNTQQDIGYIIYMETGNCPITVSLYALLTELTDSGDLTNLGATALNDYASFSGFYQHLMGLDEPQLPPHQFEWDVISFTGSPGGEQSLEVNISNTDTQTNYCFGLTLDENSPFEEFSDITGYQHLFDFQIGSPNSFSIVAYGVDDGTLVYDTLNGYTCINLNDCSFPQTCAPNQFGLDLEMLMSALATNNQLTQTTAVNLETTYSDFLTDPIRNAFPGVSTDLRWIANGLVFTLYDQSAYGENVVISFADFLTNPAGFTAAQMSQIAYFSGIVSTGDNAFIIHGYNSSNQELVVLTGTVKFEKGNVTVALPTGTCGYPPSLDCSTDPHLVKEDLQVLVDNLLESLSSGNPNYDIMESFYLTNLLSSYLPSNISSAPVSIAQDFSSNPKIEFIEAEMGGVCDFTLARSFTGPDRGIVNLISWGEIEPVGESDGTGQFFNFMITATFQNSYGTFNDIIYGESCWPLAFCDPCADLILPPPGEGGESISSGSGGFETGFGSSSGGDISGAWLDTLPLSDFQLGYGDYLQLLDTIEMKFALLGDTVNLQRISLYDYYRFDLHNFTKFRRFLEQFNPRWDSIQWVLNPTDYMASKGNVVNVQEEYARLLAAMEYVHANAWSLLSDSLDIPDFQTFVYGLQADEVRNFLAVLEDSLVSGGIPISFETYLSPGEEMQMTMNYNPPSQDQNFQECMSLYMTYVQAWQTYYNYQLTHPICNNFETIFPLISFQTFNDNYYCCSEEGLFIFQMFISTFQQFTKCPDQIQETKECEGLHDEAECRHFYGIFYETALDFNSSDWADYHSVQVDLVLLASHFDLIKYELCDCILDYSFYLEQYINANPQDPVDPYVDIFNFDGCGKVDPPLEHTCNSLYGVYLDLIEYFNVEFLPNEGGDLGYTQQITATPKQFFVDDYCDCYPQYVAYLLAVMDGLYAQSNPGYVQSIEVYCREGIPTPPCDPPGIPPFPNLTFEPIDPCAEYMLELAGLNGQVAYETYLDSVIGDFTSRYRATCLGAQETFTDGYQNLEYQYTLYYYDLAGNLIKTIPPEGVEPLDITSHQDPLAQAIASDRLNNTKTVFTFHRMASRYEFNSLGQMITQNIPDHDKKIDWALKDPTGLRKTFVPVDLQFLDGSNGFLAGSYESTNFARGLLYRTTDGGATWSRVPGLVADRINKAVLADDTYAANLRRGFAVGEEGTILYSATSGTSWDMLDLAAQGIQLTRPMNDLVMTSPSIAYMVGDESVIIGGAYQNLTKNQPQGASVNYRAIAKNDAPSHLLIAGENTANNQGLVNLVTLPNTFHSYSRFRGTDFTDISVSPAGNFSALFGRDGRTAAITANANGNIDHFSERETRDTLGLGDFVAGHFLNENLGVAIIQDDLGRGKLNQTLDGGKNWTPFANSTNEADFRNLEVSSEGDSWAKLTAVGDDGLIRTMLMYGTVAVSTAYVDNFEGNPLPDLRSAWTENSGSESAVFAGDSQGRLYYRKTSHPYDATWQTLEPTGTNQPVNQLQMARLDQGTTVFSGAFLTSAGTLHSVVVDLADEATYSEVPTPAGISTWKAIFRHGNTGIYALGLRNATQNDPAELAVYRYDFEDDGLELSASHARKPLEWAEDATAFAIGGNYAYVAGADGNVAHRNLNSTSASWVDRSERYTPLPLNDVLFYTVEIDNETQERALAAGDNGAIYQFRFDDPENPAWNAGSWVRLKTGLVRDILTMEPYEDGFLLMNQYGHLHRGTVDEETASFTTAAHRQLETEGIPLSMAVSESRIAIAGTQSLYGILQDFDGEPLWYGGDTYADYHGVSAHPGDPAKFLASGTNAELRFATGSVHQVVHDIFPPPVEAFHFQEPGMGTVVLKGHVIRSLSPDELAWDVIPPTYNPVGKKINAVYTAPNGNAMMVGDDGFVSFVNNGSAVLQQGIQLNTDIHALEFHPDNPHDGYVAGHNFMLKVHYDGNPASLSWNIVLNGAVSLPNRTWKALHVFPSGEVAIAGGNAAYLTKDGKWEVNLVPSSVSNQYPGLSLTDVHFRDDYNAYLAGTYTASGTQGLVLRSQNVAVTPDGPADFGWIAQNLAEIPSAGDPTTPADVRPEHIALSTKYGGIIAGAFNPLYDNQTLVPYVRRFHDESEEYSTHFYYDRLGRLVLSQNVVQHNAGISNHELYAYTIYDPLNRIVETGVAEDVNDAFETIFGTNVGGAQNPNVIDDAQLAAFLASAQKSEVTKTLYDKPHPFADPPTDFAIDQDNLRNRVASRTFTENPAYPTISAEGYDNAVHYSYDIHGNVKNLFVETGHFANLGDEMRFKKVEYRYDLISGNVIEVRYQDGHPDAFRHGYRYDAENRLKEVYTSTDGTVWERDAKNFYYDHGPLARTEIGQDQIQGVDYAYTLQGWLKGMNSMALDPQRDPGRDGESGPNANFAHDFYGMSLGYHETDYKPIDPSRWNNVQDRFEADFAGSNLKDARHNLYNGNIGYAVNTLADENHTPRPLGNAYRYDQLNRLVHAKSFTNLDLQTNAWKDNAPHSQIYENIFSYDLNGNIESQLRRDEGGMTIDDLTYKYDDGTYGRKRNRLYHVNDAVTASAYPDDIDDQGTFDPNAVNENNNYRYDELGRLISDAQENISQIYWRHDDKIALIVKSDTGGGIEFTYDPSGNRLSKAVFTGPQFDPIYTDYYIRDAQGNVLATYRRHFDLDLYQSHYTVAERAIYGSDRMGVYAYNDTVYPIPPNWTDDFRPIHTGHKKYELKNHLGNVMAVVHGRKQAVQGSYGVLSHYTAIPAFSGDYSAFGVKLRGRGSGDYRYGFNGMEKDDEVKGSGNSLDFGARIHDPRLGRFLSIDPLAKKYPFMSPYTLAGNNPIRFIDVNGEGPGDGPFTGKARKDKAGNISIYRLTTLDRKAMNVTRAVAGANPVGGAIETGVLVQRLYDSEMNGTIYQQDPQKDLAREVVTREGDVFTNGAATKVVTSLSIGSEIMSNPTRQELLEDLTFSIASELELGYKNIVQEGLYHITVDGATEQSTEQTFNAIYNTLDEQLGSMKLDSTDDINRAIEFLGQNAKSFRDKLSDNFKSVKNEQKKKN